MSCIHRIVVKYFCLLFFVFISCGPQQVLLNPNELYKNQTVTVETRDGEKLSGIVTLANSEAMLIRDEQGQEKGFLAKNIISAKGPEPVLDDDGILVSEAEIDSFQTNTNLTTYAIVGGFISGGISFLVSSLISHEVLELESDAPVYIGTTAGLTVGTILFANSGATKDRTKAIENVLLSRTESDYQISLPDQEDDIRLREKINEIIKEREKTEQEIENLIKDMNEIKEPIQEK